MLLITRRAGEKIMVGDDVVVHVMEILGNTVILRGLTRSPGHFANFTTWTFETDGDRIVHVSFAWRPAN